MSTNSDGNDRDDWDWDALSAETRAQLERMAQVLLAACEQAGLQKCLGISDEAWDVLHEHYAQAGEPLGPYGMAPWVVRTVGGEPGFTNAGYPIRVRRDG